MPPNNPYGYIGNNPLRQAFVTQQQSTDAQRSPFAPLFTNKNDVNREKELAAAALAAGNFAGVGESGYAALTPEMLADRARLRARAEGKDSLSAEQLRQALQQQYAMQQSMAASASPANAPMAARTAMMNANRASTSMAGQQAMAGIAERQAAEEALARASLGARGQDVDVALGSRQNQLTGLGANKPDKPKEPSTWQKLAMGAAAVAPLFSDKKLKKDIGDGDTKANRMLKQLAAKVYAYKDDAHGKGEQLGFLAQDLEKAGGKGAVIDTPIGKAIDTQKLTGMNTAFAAALARRVEKLERKK